MPYTGDLPVNSRTWQKSSNNQEVTDEEWWGWTLIDLLLEAPVILTKYLLRKIRTRVRRVFCSHQERFRRTLQRR
jgi:hypothetical protein